MKKILIIGCAGLLGSALCRYLSVKPDLFVGGAYNQKKPVSSLDQLINLDILNFDIELLKKILHKYDYIINCAKAKSKLFVPTNKNLLDIYKINSQFPKFLTHLNDIYQFGTNVINISSDAVYSGQLPVGQSYNELSTPDPLDLYGQSKYLGEAHGKNTLNIRSSFIGSDYIYSDGLLEFVRHKESSACIDGYNNWIWSGATTEQFAEFIYKIIKNNTFQKIQKYNTVNFSPNSPLSKYDLIKLMATLLNRNDLTIRNVTNQNLIINRQMNSAYDEINKLSENLIDLQSSLINIIGEAV